MTGIARRVVRHGYDKIWTMYDKFGPELLKMYIAQIMSEWHTKGFLKFGRIYIYPLVFWFYCLLICNGFSFISIVTQPTLVQLLQHGSWRLRDRLATDMNSPTSHGIILLHNYQYSLVLTKQMNKGKNWNVIKKRIIISKEFSNLAPRREELEWGIVLHLQGAPWKCACGWI